jgi:hypothetical protein
MAILIPANGDPREVLPKVGPSFDLSELQAFVGGYIEALGLDAGHVMFVNEEGKLTGLPFNYRATVLVRHVIQRNDFIVGDAIICSRLEAGEDPEADAATEAEA